MTPERRNAPPRRQDDLDNQFNEWVSQAMKHRMRLAGIVATTASVLTFIMTTTGFRLVGPPADMKALRGKVDTIKMRVEGLERSRDSLLEHQHWTDYMQCAQYVESHPNGFRPPVCKEPVR